MTIRSIPVDSGPLAPYVDRVWICKVDDASGQELLLPTGKSQLIFGLDSSSPGALVQGPTTTAATVDTTMQRYSVGASFRSGGLAAIAPGPADEYADQRLPLDVVFGRSARSLHEELASIAEPSLVFQRLYDFLAESLGVVGHSVDPAVQCAVSMLDQGERVGETAKQLGIDRRALAARFRSEVGVGLKQFARLRRFERAVAACRSVNAPTLTVIAASLGYSDQAHMTREFREFASLAPSELHRHETPAPNHVAV